MKIALSGFLNLFLMMMVLLHGGCKIGEKPTSPAIDPVCGMTVVKKNAEAEGLTSVYQGSPFYFCASSCKHYFDRNPEKYLKRAR